MCCTTHTHTLMSYTQSGNQSCCLCESRCLSQISSSATLLTLNYGFDFTAQHEAFLLKLTLMLSDVINTRISLAINANQPLCFISSQHEIKIEIFFFLNTFLMFLFIISVWTLWRKYIKNTLLAPLQKRHLFSSDFTNITLLFCKHLP